MARHLRALERAPTRFIAKANPRLAAVAGWLAHESGTLFIRREQWRNRAHQQKVRCRLSADAIGVGLFPEGFTTEATAAALPQRALRVRGGQPAHVLPRASLRGARRALCREAAFVGDTTFFESHAMIIRRQAITARVRFAPSVETEGFKRREVMKATEDRIASLLGLTPAGTASERASDPLSAPL